MTYPSILRGASELGFEDLPTEGDECGVGVAEEDGVVGCGYGDEILAVGVVWASGGWWEGAWEAEICGCSGGQEEGLDGAE